MGVGALKAVFLDRDGVLNRAFVRNGKPYPPASPDELEILPDVPAALSLLKRSGFLLLVITNQPDVARGSQGHATVEQIHAVLRTALPIDDFFVCYHDDPDHCDCRKPKPGLLAQAAVKYGVDLGARCRTIWIDRGYAEKTPSSPDATVRSCLEAAHWISTQQNQ
jgi:D-glycero-D-manno-heptose 1,7-bisphosphate phosphatase